MSQAVGGDVTLRDLSDFRNDALVDGVLDLVRQYKPLHVSLVGGEPMIRHRELSILPALSEMGVFAMVVTSGVIPIPMEWMEFPRVRVAVSVDGLPEHHDVRRKPATYVRILHKNIEDRNVNIHWVVTRPMLERASTWKNMFPFGAGAPKLGTSGSVSTRRKSAKKVPRSLLQPIAGCSLVSFPPWLASTLSYS